MAGIEEAFKKFVTRVSSREEPQDEYGDPQTGEKRIPLMQGIKRGYDFENTMPNYYNQRYDYENQMPIYQDDRYNIPQQELMGGGVASMFRERPGFQEGGVSDFELFKEAVLAANQGSFGGNMERLYNEYKYHKGPLGSSDPDSNPFFYAGDDTSKMVQAFSSIYNKSPGYGLNTTPEVPTVDPFSGQQVSAQDQPTNFPTIDPFSGKPYLTDPNAPVQPIGPAPPDNYYDEVPTIDPFSGQQVSMQDQMAFAQPQQDIFPQQNIPQPPSPVDQFIGERRFQSEADAAARSGIPFTKTIQDFIGNLYSGPQIAEMQERTFGTSGLPGATGLVSDLRHATAASQVRDRIADAASMGYFNPAGLIPQSLGLFGSQVLGAANEIQSIRPNMQSIRDIGEDLRANFLGAVQVPYGQTATATYNQLLNNPTIAAQRSQQEAAARVTPRMTMMYGGLTNTIPPAKGPDSQGVESLFRRRYS